MLTSFEATLASMEINQIRYFLALADTLNFTRASERSFISQPALTKAIQRLEESVGGRLFERAHNTVQLTDLGRAMLPSFREIYASIVQARYSASRLARKLNDLVRVGVMCTIDFDYLMPCFTDVKDRLPTVDLIFSTGSFESLTDMLDRGDIDLAIMCSPHEIPQRFKGISLYAESYVVAVSSDHRFKSQGCIELAELHREHYCERVLCEYSSYISHLLHQRGIALDVVQESEREDWIQSMVRANFGVAFMPKSIAASANLDYVLISDAEIVRNISVFSQTERPVSANLQVVMDLLAEHNWHGERFQPAVQGAG